MHLWKGLTIGYVLNTAAALVTGWLVYLFVMLVDPGVFAECVVNSKKVIAGRKKATYRSVWTIDLQRAVNIGER